MTDKLFIVIVNWNLRNDTIECIDSLLKAGILLDKIILIDNGSTDGSSDIISTNYSNQFHLISNPENIGFAAGVNQGIEYALNLQADWILLLNNDTLVAEDFLVEMSLFLTREQKYKILTPLILYDTCPERIWSIGDILIPGTLITKNSYRGKKIPDGLPDLLPVDFVSGCAMLIHSSVVKEIGVFNSDLVMYGEEIDFCWRARKIGHHLACITKARIWHKVSTSANRILPQTRYFRIRNQIFFYRKNALGIQLPLMFILSIFHLVLLLLQDVKNRQKGLLKPMLNGWFDGWQSMIFKADQ